MDSIDLSMLRVSRGTDTHYKRTHFVPLVYIYISGLLLVDMGSVLLMCVKIPFKCLQMFGA